MKDTNVPVDECCDGECNHDDCCGKVEANCTHKKSVPVEKWPEQIRDWWYERYEFKLPEAARVELEHIVKEAIQEERNRIAEEGRRFREEAELDKPPLTFSRSEADYNQGIYESRLATIDRFLSIINKHQ